MKITKRQLRRIIKEETAHVLECGEDMGGMEGMSVPVDAAPEPMHDEGPKPTLEADTPEQTLMVEIELASRSLEQVVESVQNAAHVCADCVETVAGQAPIMEAVATQAEALQEMLNAQSEMLQEGIEAQQMVDIVPLELPPMDLGLDPELPEEGG
jgi:hypothetical protein